MNLNGIAPFSSGIASITISNVGGADVSISSIEILPEVGVLQDEYRQSRPGATQYTPEDLAGTTIPASGSVTLGLFFWPMASGPRRAEIVVHTSDGKRASFFMAGRGRDNLVFSPTITKSREQVYAVAAGKVSFFDPGGGVSDGAGGIVMSGRARELYDRFSPDLAMVRVQGDGTLAWAKTWSEQYIQTIPEPNNETGGVADQIAAGADGAVYMAAARSTNSSNVNDSALVYKVDIATGAIAWAKSMRNGSQDQAFRNFFVQTVDATLPDRVIVGGTSDGRWAFAALKKSDGSLLYSRILDLASGGSAGKIYSMRIAADGTGYFGGESSSRAVIARLTALDTDTPALAWAQFTGGGIGTRIDSIDLTADGAALVAYHIGGATRTFAAGRYNSDGALAWAKAWEVTSGRATAWVVRRRANSVFVGGVFATTPLDTTAGDGLLLKLDVATGAYQTGGAFYGGKTTTTTGGHILKAFIFNGDEVQIMSDTYPGTNNYAHYWGLWYQPPTAKLDLPLNGQNGSERVIDYNPGSIAAISGASITRFPSSSGVTGGPGYEVESTTVDTATIWKDIASTDAGLYPARTYEHGPTGVFHLQTVTIRD